MKVLYGIGLGFIFSSAIVGMFYATLRLMAQLNNPKMQISLCILQMSLVLIGVCLCLYVLHKK